MQKVVCYCRTSTENQREEKTIELQVENLTKYTKTHCMEVVEWFKDDGVSGGLENRPALAKMLKFLEVNVEVEAVLIYKLDRLARDLYLQEGLIREFTKFKKLVISTIEPDLASNDPFRKAFRQFIGIVSELEKAIITLRMKNGRDSSVAKGRWHGGFIYGYDSKDGQLIINQKEAEIVKKIFYFKRYKKMTASEIANFLNKNNISTKRGDTKWWPSSVNKILTNVTYCGKIKYKGEIYEGQQSRIK